MDAIEAIQNKVMMEKAEESAKELISKGMVKLILGKSAQNAFFATLALRLRTRVDWTIDTAATDGKNLVYNPVFMLKLSDAEVVGVICHEVLHCVLKHIARLNGRNPRKFNKAADLALNPLVLDAGFSLPNGALFAGKGPEPYKSLPTGQSAEKYYELLPDDPEDEQGNDPGGCGGIQRPGDGSESAAQEQEAEWEIATAQAVNASKHRGSLPGELARIVDEVLNPKTDWREALRDFINRRAKNDYSWTRPNRRHIAAGLYLPSLHSEELGEIAVMVDTSGSINRETLNAFAAELDGILSCNPCKCTIIYHHTNVYQIDTWEPSDGKFTLSEGRSGGTSHVDAFSKVDGLEDRPCCVIALTDLETELPAAPEYPVLWACTTKGARAPFGQIIHVEV